MTIILCFVSSKWRDLNIVLNGEIWRKELLNGEIVHLVLLIAL